MLSEGVLRLRENEIKILIYLLKGKDYIRSMIKSTRIPPSSLLKSIEVLRGLGLVKVEKENRRHYIILTRKGVKVAKKYEQISRII